MSPSSTPGAVGAPRPRAEGRLKVTGAVHYAADMPMPDLAHGWMVTGTVSRGRIRNIDASTALGMPGVLGYSTTATHPGSIPRPATTSARTAASGYCRTRRFHTRAGPSRWWWRKRPSRPERRQRRCG